MIPTRFLGRCEFCHRELDTRVDGVHQAITSGWIMNRTGGGAHSVAMPKRENKWAHRDCIDRAAKGYTNQSKMF